MLQLSRATRATLDVLRVFATSDDPVWGLQVIQATSRGPGTVYPILERLAQSGWLASEWEPDSVRRGPRRRLYRLTSDGANSVAPLLQDTGKRRPRAAAPKTARA